MRLRNGKLRRSLELAAAGVLVVVVVCAPAGAATLQPAYDYCYGEVCSTSAVFSSTSAANKLVIAGGTKPVNLVPGTGQNIIAVRDPNVAITTPAQPEVPRFDEGLLDETVAWLSNGSVAAPVWATFNCVAPTGKGTAACVATPGFGFSYCTLGGCPFGSGFRELRVWLGGAADTVTLLPGSIAAQVSAGGGNDTLDTRNGAVDRIDCGDGADTVAADAKDNVAANCETVRRGRP